MSEDRTVDMIRWTFTADPAKSAEIERLLVDLGLEVTPRGGGRFVATWEEPEGDVDEVVEQLWEINGSPFEVTHEAFRRLELLAYSAEPEADRGAA
ncbi:hypothetical protein [Tautonia plasticadhaerens]|uniref:Uncharacterized protein n=1 Tax=Tautonia plasticadhaerens TaxID=2527974 RepID=A0A518H9T4_9BACT|nr:hypothetical protein [Tautonia plasticadhaerens]QDV37611.1 hypothetical protein ElP_55520 [Tautonia plasticadhaerens]